MPLRYAGPESFMALLLSLQNLGQSAIRLEASGDHKVFVRHDHTESSHNLSSCVLNQLELVSCTYFGTSSNEALLKSSLVVTNACKIIST